MGTVTNIVKNQATGLSKNTWLGSLTKKCKINPAMGSVISGDFGTKQALSAGLVCAYGMNGARMASGKIVG